MLLHFLTSRAYNFFRPLIIAFLHLKDLRHVWRSSIEQGPRSSAQGPQVNPAFLLPRLKLNFKRKRSSLASIAASPDEPGSPPRVPSLSSSPASTASSSRYSPSSVSVSPFSPMSAKSFPEFHDPDARPSWTHPRPGLRLWMSPSARRGCSRRSPDTLRCGTCSADLAFGAQIVSKGFTGRHRRAYLVSPPSTLSSPSSPGSPTNSLAQPAGQRLNMEDLVNVHVGRAENRQLVTGAHVVADISCAVCGIKLGWKYVGATEGGRSTRWGSSSWRRRGS